MLNDVLPEEKFVKEMIDASKTAINHFELAAKVHMDLYKSFVDWYNTQLHKLTS